MSETDGAPPLDVLDQVAVKRGIDDCIGKLCTLAGYPEDFTLSNAKLIIMTAACGMACFAQFGPHSFPDNRNILAACVGLYTLACAVLHLISTLIEKNIVARTYDKEGKPGSALMISTFSTRGDNNITIKAEFRDSSRQESEEITKSFGRYFSEKGELDEIRLQKDLQYLIIKMEAKASKKTK